MAVTRFKPNLVWLSLALKQLFFRNVREEGRKGGEQESVGSGFGGGGLEAVLTKGLWFSWGLGRGPLAEQE